MRVRFVELARPGDQGSIGAHFIAETVLQEGHVIVDEDADVELVSVHHATEWPLLRDLEQRAPVRLVGGHPMANNPRPAIPFADAICIGEGEEWVRDALQMLDGGSPVEDLATLPGTIVRSLWDPGMDPPKANQVHPLPRFAPYLNRSGSGHARVWYIEMARGCPFDCHYCELGWTVRLRQHRADWLHECIDAIDVSQSRRVTLFAPDEASHPAYASLLEHIHDRGLTTGFGSMRLDQIMRKGLPLKPNMLIRVGIDGLTESTRMRVNKPITDADIVAYFRYMAERGHRNFKMFMVFGYPWESPEDFSEFERMMGAVLATPVTANTHLRIKWTPLIPQPSTPLGDVEPRYDDETVRRIRVWMERVAKPRRHPGWYVENDGLMSRANHRRQVELTRGDEWLLAPSWEPRKAGK